MNIDLESAMRQTANRLEVIAEPLDILRAGAGEIARLRARVTELESELAVRREGSPLRDAIVAHVEGAVPTQATGRGMRAVPIGNGKPGNVSCVKCGAADACEHSYPVPGAGGARQMVIARPGAALDELHAMLTLWRDAPQGARNQISIEIDRLRADGEHAGTAKSFYALCDEFGYPDVRSEPSPSHRDPVAAAMIDDLDEADVVLGNLRALLAQWSEATGDARDGFVFEIDTLRAEATESQCVSATALDALCRSYGYSLFDEEPEVVAPAVVPPVVAAPPPAPEAKPEKRTRKPRAAKVAREPVGAPVVETIAPVAVEPPASPDPSPLDALDSEPDFDTSLDLPGDGVNEPSEGAPAHVERDPLSFDDLPETLVPTGSPDLDSTMPSGPEDFGGEDFPSAPSADVLAFAAGPAASPVAAPSWLDSTVGIAPPSPAVAIHASVHLDESGLHGALFDLTECGQSALDEIMTMLRAHPQAIVEPSTKSFRHVAFRAQFNQMLVPIAEQSSLLHRVELILVRCGFDVSSADWRGNKGAFALEPAAVPHDEARKATPAEITPFPTPSAAQVAVLEGKIAKIQGANAGAAAAPTPVPVTLAAAPAAPGGEYRITIEAEKWLLILDANQRARVKRTLRKVGIQFDDALSVEKLVTAPFPKSNAGVLSVLGLLRDAGVEVQPEVVS